MSLNEVGVLTGHVGRVWNCAWSPDGATLATTGEDKTIRLWKAKEEEDPKSSGDFVCQTILSEGHERTIRQISWHPNGKLLASASFDGTIVVWDRSGGQFESILTLEGHENEVKSAAWSPSGDYLATCSRDKSVWLWQKDEEEDDEFMCASVLQAHSQDVKRVLWNPHQDILTSCSYDNKIKIFVEDDDDWVCVSTLSGHENTVWSMDYDTSGRYLASVSEDTTLKIWKEFKEGNKEGVAVESGKFTWKSVCNLSGIHDRSIYDVSWSKLNGLIATASGDNSIRIFRRRDENSEEEFNLDLIHSEYAAHSEDVNSIEWNPKNPSTLASTSDDGSVKIWKFNPPE